MYQVKDTEGRCPSVRAPLRSALAIVYDNRTPSLPILGARLGVRNLGYVAARRAITIMWVIAACHAGAPAPLRYYAIIIIPSSAGGLLWAPLRSALTAASRSIEGEGRGGGCLRCVHIAGWRR